jgi:hypothetical protein
MTRFKVSGPGAQGGTYDSADQALKEASRLLPMASGSSARHLANLNAGKITAWAYGFKEVWIEPIVQRSPSVTGE